ncbi:protein-disulfide reductase DsbD family protein [Simiduia agarivorans]|uniref:Thiol:disulfide interchange protein n=1 Tax=Simiduia agarivorans (strain DSM 21679 / JCM 13881 / BCRC 17597 / SA1) TaxID=1117647 RepID=K4KYP1_SIMAS|nr:thioredoxin family protein [Simiduia agarivorans]AFU99062.1 thiol:disulfide interchange protein [Simiduia agarivorans SA1 = DSM 21679]
MSILRYATVALLLALCLPSHLAQAASTATAPHINVALIAETDSYQADQPLWVGVLFEPDPEWHTYWLNPGDSGEPPVINLSLPPGVSAGPWRWQTPDAISVAHLVNFGYGRNLLMTQLMIPGSSDVPLTIGADVTWLVCKEDCIPGDAVLELTLPATDTKPSLSVNATAFRWSRAQHYETRAIPAYFQVTEQTIALELPAGFATQWLFFPFQNDWVNHALRPQAMEQDGFTRLSFNKSDAFWETPVKMRWLAKHIETGEAFSFTALPASPASEAGDHWVWFLGLAFMGGLILNIMPCVLPVLAIKAFSLAQHSNQRSHGHAYAAGVLVSFWVFALLIEFAKTSGELLGWGFQMQSPGFVASLTLLFFTLGLWLLDGFRLGGSLQNVGNGHITQQGIFGSFSTGCLAVLVATPCTAPFMAVALGYGLQASSLQNLLIFTALAIGFAAPLWVIHLNPQVTHWLPKPGPWMETAKHGLAFPLFATSIWLSWVLLGLGDPSLLILCLIAALIIGIAGYLTRASGYIRVFGTLLALSAFILLPIATSEVNEAQGEQPIASTDSLAAIDAARAQGKSVLVNVTADWCITCKVNEQVAFQTDAVRARLEQPDIAYIEIDWTRKNPEIFAYLQRFGRSGVPLYVYYPENGDPRVLPQILTPDLVLSHLTGEAP